MKTENYIGGKWVNSDSKIGVFNPANGQKIAEVSSASIADIQLALESAESAVKEYAEFDIDKKQ